MSTKRHHEDEGVEGVEGQPSKKLEPESFGTSTLRVEPTTVPIDDVKADDFPAQPESSFPEAQPEETVGPETNLETLETPREPSKEHPRDDNSDRQNENPDQPAEKKAKKEEDVSNLECTVQAEWMRTSVSQVLPQDAVAPHGPCPETPFQQLSYLELMLRYAYDLHLEQVAIGSVSLHPEVREALERAGFYIYKVEAPSCKKADKFEFHITCNKNPAPEDFVNYHNAAWWQECLKDYTLPYSGRRATTEF